jgi:hypothetical protein
MIALRLSSARETTLLSVLLSISIYPVRLWTSISSEYLGRAESFNAEQFILSQQGNVIDDI